MARPRLIYLVTRFPHPLHRGDHLRTFRFLERFAAIADVTLVAFHDAPVPAASLAAVRPFCARIETVPHGSVRGRAAAVRGLFSSEPLQVGWYASGAMRRTIGRLAGEAWDVGFCSMLRMHPYLERLRCRIRVLDYPDSGTLRYARAAACAGWRSRWLLAEELRRVERYERSTLARVDEAWVVAAPDRDEFLSRVSGANVVVVPNGIETRWGAAGLEGPKQDVALFLGDLTVGHNRDAVLQLAALWPAVRARRPAATLVLVGRHGPELRRVARGDGIELAGYVEDLRPLLRRARLAVATLRYASGLQNKVIETMAAGLPNVVTAMVNDAIGAKPGESIALVDGEEETVASVANLLADPAAARRMGEAGRSWVTGRFDWSAAGDALRRLLDRR